MSKGGGGGGKRQRESEGVWVGRGKGVMYFASPGRPNEIGLQMGKACYPCSR